MSVTGNMAMIREVLIAGILLCCNTAAYAWDVDQDFRQFFASGHMISNCNLERESAKPVSKIDLVERIVSADTIVAQMPDPKDFVMQICVVRAGTGAQYASIVQKLSGLMYYQAPASKLFLIYGPEPTSIIGYAMGYTAEGGSWTSARTVSGINCNSYCPGAIISTHAGRGHFQAGRYIETPATKYTFVKITKVRPNENTLGSRGPADDFRPCGENRAECINSLKNIIDLVRSAAGYIDGDREYYRKMVSAKPKDLTKITRTELPFYLTSGKKIENEIYTFYSSYIPGSAFRSIGNLHYLDCAPMSSNGIDVKLVIYESLGGNPTC